MTREQAKSVLPIITAYAEGKDVEHKNDYGVWSKVNNGFAFVDPADRYRIAPEKKYRPFTMNEIMPHRERWIKYKNDSDSVFRFTGIWRNGVSNYGSFYNYADALEMFTFENGEPLGVLE